MSKLHYNNKKGKLERCRCKKKPCPFGGAVAQTVSRHRDKSKPKEELSKDLPMASTGVNKITQRILEREGRPIYSDYKEEVEKAKVQEASKVKPDRKKSIKKEKTALKVKEEKKEPPAPPRPLNPHNGEPYPESYDITMSEKWHSLTVNERLVEMDRLVRSRLAELGYVNVPVKYTNDKKILGITHYTWDEQKKERVLSHFSFSTSFGVGGNYEDLFDTINHEAAHAMTKDINASDHNSTGGHSEEWRQLAVANGSTGHRCGDVTIPSYLQPYRMVCQGCGLTHYSPGKKTTSRYHPACKEAGRESDFIYEKNPDYVGKPSMENALKEAGKDHTQDEIKEQEQLQIALDRVWEDFEDNLEKNMDAYHLTEEDKQYVRYMTSSMWKVKVKPNHSYKYMKRIYVNLAQKYISERYRVWY